MMHHGETSQSGAFFQEQSNPKHDEIKKLLESDSIGNKLEAMKRLIAMMSKGRNVIDLFPNVVKNIICPDADVKKLVYLFLIHYAEFEQDLALLSIATLQKDLDNPNPMIRGQALRVISSIRLPVIIHVLLISVKRCAGDNSPYVRKAAAHAIPKIYSLDHEQKSELVNCIELLLGDNMTIVLGSALSAFAEVCPERLDLLHPHFRKICNVLGDIDEWGQIGVVNTLARYARTQFENPNPEENSKPVVRKKKTSFYSDSEGDSESESGDDQTGGQPDMDPDHRLLLRATTPLLQSRNSGVVLAVASLHYYCAPKAEAMKIGKALVRIVRNPPQVATIVLQNIVTVSQTRPEIFGPYLTEFFVFDNDTPQVRGMKLEILTNIASEASISKIMRELTHYVKKEQKEFVITSIRAIGKCAARLPEVQDSCMHGLMALLSNRSELVVAESVVAIKGLMQIGAGENSHVVPQLAKLLPQIQSPNARASIVWMVGEYNAKIPLVAPDIFRVLAQSFKKEHKTVKQQILSLGAKLVLANTAEPTIMLLFQYVCNMAKFDTSYDVRDRARVLRIILLSNSTPTLRQHGLQLLCSTKSDLPDVSSDETVSFTLSSLSHSVGHTAFGYQRLPEWPEEVPDPSVRNQVARLQRREFQLPGANQSSELQSKVKGFYSDDEESSEYSDYSDSFSSSDSESFSSDDDDDAPKKKKSSSSSATKKKGAPSTPTKKTSSSSSVASPSSFFDSPSTSRKPSTPVQSSSSKNNKKKPAPPVKKKKVDKYGFSESESEESSDDFSSSEDEPVITKKPAATTSSAAAATTRTVAPASPGVDAFFGFSSGPSTSTAKPASSSRATTDLLSTDLLGLDLNMDSSTPILSTTSGGGGGFQTANFLSLGEVQRPKLVLLNHLVGQGLKIEYQFLRRTSIEGPDYVPVQLWLQNCSSAPLNNVSVKNGGSQVVAFSEINFIPPGATVEALLNVKFTSPSMAVKFTVAHQDHSFNVELPPLAGELISPANVGSNEFQAMRKKLSGMQEVSGAVNAKRADQAGTVILSHANVAPVVSSNSEQCFAGKTVIGKDDLLIIYDSSSNKLFVNCGNVMFATAVFRELKKVLEN